MVREQIVSWVEIITLCIDLCRADICNSSSSNQKILNNSYEVSHTANLIIILSISHITNINENKK